MSEHDAAVTQTASPIEDRTPAPAAGEMPVALATIGAAGNAAFARQTRNSGSHLAGLSVAGNAAVQRAVGRPGQGGGAAPSGFTDRLGTAEAGRPIPDEHRQSLESSFGTSLGDVRLHIGSQSSQLAAEVSANAFTVNKDIYFGEGQFSPGSQQGYHLLAHEVTHTLQQGGALSASSATVSDPADASEREAEDVATRVTQQRSAGDVHGVAPDVSRDATDLIPDFILDGVKSAISAIPGYDLLAGIIGKDPITGQPVQMSRTQLIEKLLTYGPFGANVGQVLQAVDVLGDVYTLVTDGLSAHNLTMARIERDIGAAWDELSVTNGIDGNAAIVRRYVDAILNDVSGFVGGIVDQVIEKVRAVVAEVAEPHLQGPQIKPVWDLARKVLHYDPLRGTDVNAPTVEILGDFLRLIGKDQVLAQMTERGTLQQTADWLDTQFATFVSIKNDLLQLFADAWDAISPQNLPRLLDTLPPLAQRAFDLVKRIGDFAWTVISKALELIKASLLGWLSQHAHEMPGFRLMTVMIRQNPFTGEAVPRTAANLIGGFIALLPNGEATYQQLAESGVIDDAAGRIESAMARLNITTDLITGTFLGIWNSLTLDDLLAPIPAFERVLARFQDPLNRILEFVTEVVQVVIELILKLMNFPSDLIGNIVSNAAAAIDDIQRDPVAFLLNMLQALKSGFMGFFDNILPFLLDGLTSWLLRGLGQIGITRPPDLSLESILGLALQVLGITADSLWQKVGEHIGPERMQQMRGGVDRLTGAWQFIKDVQQGGAAAIWQYVTDRLSGLWDTVVEMAKNWIMSEIVEKVTAKLISMLDPTGVMAVINSFIAFFNAIQSAIEYLRDILTIVDEYVTTFAQVAAGNIVPGAQKITQGLAHAVPIAIGFLANQVGIGNIPEKIVEIITGLREMVDSAIDWLIQQAVSLGQSAMGALGIGGEQPAAEQPPGAPAAPVPGAPGELVVNEPLDLADGGHTLQTDGDFHNLVLHSNPIPVSSVPNPALQALYQTYVTAATAYTANLAQYDNPEFARSRGAEVGIPPERVRLGKAEVERAVAAIRAWVLANGVPPTDAPGLGDVRPYRAQHRRFDDILVWRLEAEHLIPNGYFNAMLEGLRLPRVTDAEYRSMSTVMLYERAAEWKTSGGGGDEGDRQIMDEIRDWADAYMAELHADGGLGFGDSADDEHDHMMSRFARFITEAVDRTLRQIAAEQQTNGPSRGHPANASMADFYRPKLEEVKARQLAQFDGILHERLRRSAAGGRTTF
ncbi:hypothetical protein JOF56_007168 [Kibdelosporangium banguiense]|uniref:eCIS core domain-containing protein n=1 Tax=Kibdelosporangium banguiense TaxID=1365924 RepID=A0ABS4TS91_9PSEU|nr:DUF4157 domain-containing protein [Kibdelosporangium banguiense]MBP2326783.1 hypothetical protein [Kibdelosporangium banguiense]